MSLTIYHGPVKALKTTRLLTELRTLAFFRNHAVIVVNSTRDTRPRSAEVVDGEADSVLTTHAVGGLLKKESEREGEGEGEGGRIVGARATLLSEVSVKAFTHIGVDEGQFFTDLVPTVWQWVVDMEKHVIVAGLELNAYLRPLGDISLLRRFASTTVPLYAVCDHCMEQKRGRRDAAFSAYRDPVKANMRNAGDGSVFSSVAPGPITVPETAAADLPTGGANIDVGGCEKYVALCWPCFRTHTGLCASTTM